MGKKLVFLKKYKFKNNSTEIFFTYFLLFLGLTNKIFSEETEIFIGKSLFFQNDIVTEEILTTSEKSTFKFEKILPNAYIFKGNKMGTYEFRFTDEFGEKITKRIKVRGKKYTKEMIDKFFKDRNIYDVLKELYVYSDDTLETQRLIYEYLGDKSKENGNVDFILNIFLVSKMFLKNFEHEQKEFLEKIYLTKKEIGDIRGEVLILKFLKSYDENYKIIHAKRALEKGINDLEALNDLEDIVEKNLNFEAAKILGLYYLKKDIIKSEKYLYISDKKEFFKLLLMNGKEEKYSFYYDKLKEEDKIVIDEIKAEFDRDKIIELYLQKGKLNIEEERYEIAKEYYSKILSLSQNEVSIKSALFNVGKIYINEENYKEALELFNGYLKKYDNIDEVEALFYLGLCNFKLKNLEKSDIIFNQIKKTYKYSIWDEKIKILLKEI